MTTRGRSKLFSNRLQRGSFWAALVLVSGVPRFLCAFLLPNPDGDPYSYLEAIERLRASIAGGRFSIRDTFGFWLPLYQFLTALLSLVVDHPIYVSKMVSALCGTGICILVFQFASGITDSRWISVLAFALVALNPLHIFYSAFTGPDIPHAFLVLLSLSCVMKRRWVLASVFAGLAGLMRVESWMLIALIPALQFLIERRISVAAVGTLLIAPALWLYICWAATGNALAYFAIRDQYIRETLAACPELTHFSWERIRLNTARMTTAINHAVLIGGFAGAWLAIKRATWSGLARAAETTIAAVSQGVFYLSFLSFLVFSFVTNNQPDLWERYGLILFALGIPLLAWAYVSVDDRRPRMKRAAASLVVAASLWQFAHQVPYLSLFREQGAPDQIIANKLRDLHLQNPGAAVFSDDATVPALSGVPPAATYDSRQSPTAGHLFLAYLQEHGIEYVVIADAEDSTPIRLFPELSRGIGNESFQLIAPITARDWHGKVWLYQYRKSR